VTPNTFAILLSVSTFAPVYGLVHNRLTVLNETSEARDSFPILYPFSVATSLMRNLNMGRLYCTGGLDESTLLHVHFFG